MNSFILFAKPAILLLFLLCLNKAHTQTLTRNQTGYQDGFYYTFWNDGANGTVSMTLKPGWQVYNHVDKHWQLHGW